MTATEGHEEAASAVREAELEELRRSRRHREEAFMSCATVANQEFLYGRRYQPTREERYLEEQRYRRR